MDLRKSAGGKTLPACFECHGKVLCCNRFRKIGGRGTDLAACSPCGGLGLCVVCNDCAGCGGSGDFAGVIRLMCGAEVSVLRCSGPGVFERRDRDVQYFPRQDGVSEALRTGIAGRFGVMRKVPKRKASLGESCHQSWKTWQSITEKMSGFCRITSASFSMGFDGGTKFPGIFPGEKSWVGWT